MSKGIGRVAAAIGTGGLSEVARAAGGAIGGGSSPLSSKPKFIGATKDVDKDAFKIKESEEAAKRAKEQEVASQQRSEQAQSDRRGLIENLQAQAAGTTPSLAEAQLRSASDRNLAQQLAAAQSARGGSAAARERQLMRSQAQAGRELAQDAATAGLQERQQAQQMLGEQIGQEQQLADQLTQNYLAQGFQIEQARQQALADYEKLQTNQFLSAQGLTAASTEAGAARQSQLYGSLIGAGGSMGMMAAMSDKNKKKNIKKAGNKEMKDLTDRSKTSDDEVRAANRKQLPKSALERGKRKEAKKAAEKQNKAEMAGVIMSKMSETGDKMAQASQNAASAGRELAARKAAEISDKNKKKNIKQDIKKDFLDALTAYTYDYKNPKDPGAGEGRHMSVMAQDLEKTEIGKSMVKTLEDGTKMVDYGKGFGAILAAQAHLNKRLEEIDKKMKKGKK